MTLTDLLGRDLRVEWHEAVALVRDVIEQIPEEDSAAAPDLDQVELLPWGEVKVHGTDAAAEPVERLTQMLQVLLTNADPPVQLRLLISQPQSSLQAYSESLGFFERPDRTAILQALFNRASAAVPLADADVVAGSLGAATLRLQNDPEPAAVGAAPRGRKLVIAVALLVVLVAAAGALYASRAEGTSSTGGASAMVSKGVSEVTSAVGSAVSAIGERVGLRGTTADPAPVEAARPPAPEAAAARTKQSGRAPARNDGPPLQRARMSAYDLEASRTDLVPEADSETPPVVVAESILIVASDTPEVVYSFRSPGVAEPVALRPQLPKELPADVRPEDLTRIELLILPDGTVESVKLLGDPRNVHETMLLSAAKAWRFHPATKDGVPVRYRKTVWIAR